MCRRACPRSLATGFLTLALAALGINIARGADEVVVTDGTRALVEAAARELAEIPTPPTPPADESLADVDSPATAAAGGPDAADACDSCADACAETCAPPCESCESCGEACATDACDTEACGTEACHAAACGDIGDYTCEAASGDCLAGTCGTGLLGSRGCLACSGGRLRCGRCGGAGCLACCLRRGDYIDRWFNCGCDGSYKFPVPPLYTYHWPGLYSQQMMTDYHSPWRFPPLRPYTDEGPIPPEEELTATLEPSAGVRPASYSAGVKASPSAGYRGRPSMSEKLERFYGERD